jgi:hypothetical protein
MPRVLWDLLARPKLRQLSVDSDVEAMRSRLMAADGTTVSGRRLVVELRGARRFKMSLAPKAWRGPAHLVEVSGRIAGDDANVVVRYRVALAPAVRHFLRLALGVEVLIGLACVLMCVGALVAGEIGSALLAVGFGSAPIVIMANQLRRNGVAADALGQALEAAVERQQDRSRERRRCPTKR